MCTSSDNTFPTAHQCKSHGVSNCIADPTHLFRVTCTDCDYARDFYQHGAGAAKYLYHRRRTRAARGLLSVGAPLDVPSSDYLCRTAAECGIISNTTSPHVSLVEGLVPDIDHTASVRRLKDSLFRNPTLTVVSVHRVPRRDNVMDLILADVVLNPNSDYAAKQLADGKVCKLPQFPFHVALGACPRAGGGSKRAAEWAESRLRGVMLAMDATRVRVLPPPEGGRKSDKQATSTSSPRRGGGSPRHHQHQRHQPRHHQRQAMQQNQYQQWQQHHHHAESQPQQWQNQHGVESHQHQHQQQWPQRQGSFESPVVVNAGYESPAALVTKSSSGYETDETDAASTSTASSLAEEQEAQFPGLAVDLTFLD